MRLPRSLQYALRVLLMILVVYASIAAYGYYHTGYNDVSVDFGKPRGVLEIDISRYYPLTGEHGYLIAKIRLDYIIVNDTVYYIRDYNGTQGSVYRNIELMRKEQRAVYLNLVTNVSEAEVTRVWRLELYYGLDELHMMRLSRDGKETIIKTLDVVIYLSIYGDYVRVNETVLTFKANSCYFIVGATSSANYNAPALLLIIALAITYEAYLAKPFLEALYKRLKEVFAGQGFPGSERDRVFPPPLWPRPHKGSQHRGFPRGLPPQYSPGGEGLNSPAPAR